jgi:heme oxygenase
MTYDSRRIMDLLRESTDEQHRDAERRRLQREMVQGRLPVERYGLWLGQMYLLHSALRDAIERHATDCPTLAAIVQDEGLHVEHLRADLAILGQDAEAVVALSATAHALEEIDRAAKAEPHALLGYNYVLEGSMNGNRFIARALAHTQDAKAVSYLDPYGDEQRPVWLAYRERMNAAGFDVRQAGHMVEAARAMFAFVARMSDDVMEVAVPV